MRAIAPDVLRHRILPSYEATAEGWDGDRLVAELLRRACRCPERMRADRSSIAIDALPGNVATD